MGVGKRSRVGETGRGAGKSGRRGRSRSRVEMSNWTGTLARKE